MNFSKPNRILAISYAVGLGIGETALNWGNWQYAPLWIVDYMIVAALLYGALQPSIEKSASILKAAWSFAFGVMYMALFISIDPAMMVFFEAPDVIIMLMALLVSLSVVGFILAILTEKTIRQHQS